MNGRRVEPGVALLVFAGLGIAGLIATGLLALVDARQAAYSYLVAFSDFCGIAVGSLLLLASFHASHARWMTVLRRPLEAASATCVLFAVLFVPVAIAARPLFPWVAPTGDFTTEQMAMLVHKQAVWLNVPFWLVRAAVYFAVWIVFAALLYVASMRADDQPAEGPALLRRQRLIAAASLVPVGLAMTFAAFDWLMSLQPLWYSTIFGVYWFAGSFVAAIAVLILAVTLPPGRALFGAVVNEEHLHNLGLLLFAFIVFWAYIAFSQLLLIWIGDLPHEVPFYILRGHGGWLAISIVLIVCHFVVPFFALLPRAPKRRPGYLAFWAIWILAVHHLDQYWLVMPVLRPGAATPHLADLTALVGVGGVSVAFGLLALRGRFALPIGDPTLDDSRRYVKA